ncbi:MAG: hypothetical protein PSX36_11300 [bacterium]|nr:hypothetical protein [bacterium]
MCRTCYLFFLVLFVTRAYAQNDLDAIRYSRPGIGGTSRVVAMGGAFGALGADLSCAAYNPAGLAVFRGGDISFSGGLKTTGNVGTLYNTTTSNPQAAFVFNNFGIVGAWPSQSDCLSRHILAFTNTQIQNFESAVSMSGYTNSNSIAKDMLNLAQGKSLTNLNNSYEGLGYDTYLLDYDSLGKKYFSFLDTKRTVKQTRDLVTTGRVNELNFSYAYTYKDRFYLGASLGLPQVRYESTMTHSEYDDKDSMRVVMTSDSTYNTTYVDGLPFVYASRLGFNEMTYTEYFKTTGSGVNLKLGGVVRVNDMLRIGAYYHTPTKYRLTDEYYNALSVSFDKNKTTPKKETYPAEGGVYSYRIITPARLGLNAGFIFQKKGLLAVDYEYVNYRKASLQGASAADFATANDVLQKKYSGSHNLKVGAELNLDPFKLRAGWAVNGSPFGNTFGGSLVRNTMSVGFGYKSAGGFYLDAVLAYTFSYEDYYLFSTLDAMAKLDYRSASFGVTTGFKF